ncbi:CAP domain-containing protein [Trichothermofontia sp.]
MSTAFIQQVIALTNQERAKLGLRPLVPDSRLINAAEAHSEDMALNDYFSHISLNGADEDSRAAAFGFPGGVGENIGVGYVSPADVVAGWMDSPGHRANILNPNYQSIGIGYFFLANDTGNVNYKHYWVQKFGLAPGNNVIPNLGDGGTNDPGAGDPGSGNTSGNIVGTEGNDVLTGSNGNDTLSGRGGNDFLHGRQGNDQLFGEAGNDTLRGGKGSDRVDGGDGNDSLYGDRDNDTVIGGNGDDLLYGGKDNDLLLGEAGNDTLVGDLGQDTLIGGPGSDVYVLGSDTFDIVFYDDLEDFIKLPSGLTFADLTISQGLDQYVQDGQIETLLTNRNTGQLLAVLPSVEASVIEPEDFIF